MGGIKTLLTVKKVEVDSKDSLKKAIKMKSQFYSQKAGLKVLESNDSNHSVISLVAEVPAPIKKAMDSFIESHPSWDQYRFVQAALASFLIKNGVKSRLIARLYIKNSFSISSTKEKML